MKKILTALTAAIAAIVMCVCLAACGNGASDVAGTYKYYGTISNGETHYVTEPGIGVTEDYIVLTLNEDGTGSETMKFGPENETSANFTWKIDGSKVTITADGRDLDGKLEGELLYLYSQGENSPTFILKKAA